MNKSILTLVVIVIALLGGYYVFTSPPAGDNQTANVAEFLSGDNAIYMENQLPGTEVVVRGVKLSAAGYVVVHLVAEDGTPGDIVGGTGLIVEGTHENISVTLSGLSQVGDIFIAMLHTDNGDGVVNAEEDVPVVDEDENIIMMSFNIVSEVLDEETEESEMEEGTEEKTADEEVMDEETTEDNGEVNL